MREAAHGSTMYSRLDVDLPIADALVLAAARALGAELITSDTDFKNIPGVRVL